MKTVKPIILILLLSISAISCNHKPSHEEALKYYVIIQLQTKEVTNLVKTFSEKLSHFTKQYTSPKKDLIFMEAFDSIKNDYHNLILLVDSHIKVVDDISFTNNILYLKIGAKNYIKDVREILINDVFKRINLYKTTSDKKNKHSRFDIELFKSRKDIFVLDSKMYKKLSEIYREQFHIMDDELIGYSLKN